MSIQDEQKRLQRDRSEMGHQLKELHRQEKISMSVCCNGPMQEENNQCLCCGADGSQMSEKEKQELVDEKIRYNSINE